MVPLPFGEYLPFAETFPFLYDLIDGPGNFKAGTNPTLFEAEGTTFATPICYEAILPRAIRRLQEADVFVNITNDAWFGDTAAPHQHAMLAVARAVEFGRPMVRVAYTGVNMIVEPHGRVVYETSPFTEAAEVVELRLGKVDTPYRRWGDLFAFACLALSGLSIALLGLPSRRGQQASIPASPGFPRDARADAVG
jgi:apolipoprotein N-acyltransferase